SGGGPRRPRGGAGARGGEPGGAPGPPHRLSGFRVGGSSEEIQVTDARTAEPPTISSGVVPATAQLVAMGLQGPALPGVVLAGRTPDGANWVIAGGRAD